MYRCTHCNATFSEPVQHRQRFDFNVYGAGAELVELVCPECGEGEFEEADMCLLCGDYYPASEMHDDICPDCYEAASNRLTTYLIGEFSKYELQALANYYDFTDAERIKNDEIIRN